MKLTLTCKALIAAVVLAIPQTANACRIPMTREQLAGQDERHLSVADQVIVGDVSANSANVILPNYIDRVDLVNVRALRGEVSPTLTIQQETVFQGCGKSFSQNLEDIRLEPVLILLRQGYALQIYRLNSPFARSVIERLEQTPQ